MAALKRSPASRTSHGSVKWRRAPQRADRFFDDCDDRFLEEFQQPHARTVATRSFMTPLTVAA
jgi:hypothetical protein